MTINRQALLMVTALVAVTALAAVISVAKRADERGAPAVNAVNAAPDAADKKTKTNADDVFMAEKTAVTAEDVAYFGDVRGLYAHPVDGGRYPGVVMIHEWWGLNDGIRSMAKTLAGQGFAVLAVDLYDGKVASTPDEATALVKGVDQGRALENMRAAVEFLRAKGSTKIASLGWCFGGGQSLQLALGERLDATVVYYGTPLVTDADALKAISWPVLGIFGQKDQVIPVESVQSFEKALSGLGIPHDVRLYAGVGHAFANPSGPNYDQEKSRDAWFRTVQFLTKNLQ